MVTLFSRLLRRDKKGGQTMAEFLAADFFPNLNGNTILKYLPVLHGAEAAIQNYHCSAIRFTANKPSGSLLKAHRGIRQQKMLKRIQPLLPKKAVASAGERLCR